MTRFSAKDALLAGVTMVRRRPMNVVIWLVLFLAVGLILAAIAQAQLSSLHADAQTRAAMIKPTLLMLAADAVLSGLSSVLIWGAAFRGLLQPQDHRPGGLALGRREWTMLGARVLIAAIFMLFLLLFSLLMMSGHVNPRAWLGSGGWVGAVIGIVTGFWAALASVWAFEREELALIRCWRVTRDHFWPLVGVFAVVSLAAYLLRQGLRAAATAMNGHVAIASPAGIDAMSGPALVQRMGGAVVNLAEIIIMAGIVATAWRARAPDVEAEPIYDHRWLKPASRSPRPPRFPSPTAPPTC